MERCSGNTTTGRRCKMDAVIDGFCLTHSNAARVIQEAARAKNEIEGIGRQLESARAQSRFEIERIKREVEEARRWADSEMESPKIKEYIQRTEIARARAGEAQQDLDRRMSALHSARADLEAARGELIAARKHIADEKKRFSQMVKGGLRARLSAMETARADLLAAAPGVDRAVALIDWAREHRIETCGAANGRGRETRAKVSRYADFDVDDDGPAPSFGGTTPERRYSDPGELL